MRVESVIPEGYLGTVQGDVNRRRGNLMGMEMNNGSQVIKAEIPLSEMFGYSTALRSNTQGRGNYTMTFDHYSEVPKNIADKIIGESAKKN